MKLTSGTHFVVLQKIPNHSEHTIHLFKRYDDALANWEAGNRISPIFPINFAELPNLSDGKDRFIHLIGPIYPGNVICSGNLFLSFGIFNILVISEEEQDYNSVVSFLKTQNTNWEEWNLVGNKIRQIEYHSLNPDYKTNIPPHVLSPIKIDTAHIELRGPIFEYRAQIASSITKSALCGLPSTQYLLSFDIIFRNLLTKNMMEDSMSKHGLLTTANSILSRYSDQTLGGTSPVTETECNVKSHSLLGLGVASLALQRIIRFIENVFSNVCILDRLKSLEKVAATSSPLFQLKSSDKFWNQDHLYGHNPQKKLTIPTQRDNEVLPLLTCFSGRDGFRSTHISLSVPLATITSCNTTSWTLLTLTHEISHTIIEGVLGLLLPNPDDNDAINNTVKILNNNKDNLFQQLREMLCFSCWVVANKGKIEGEINSDNLPEIIRTLWVELNEILTHIFDFLYFYRKDAKHYVRSIWASWGVIPNIRHRIPEYIVRTLCALHANNIRRKDKYKITLDQLKEYLTEIFKNSPDSPYIQEAIGDLNKNYKNYFEALRNRELLIKFVRFFLYSPEIQTMLEREPEVSGGDKGGYQAKVLEFSDITVKNPLRFIEEFSRDKSSDKQRSLWLFQQLAFEK